MKRRVVRHGTATLTISLPVNWTKKCGIKQGDELDIDERGDKIIVRPYNQLNEKEVVLVTNKKEDFAKRFITAPYILGYNLIKVKYNDKEVLKGVQEVVSNFLMGFEIIEQGENYCILKNIAKGIEEEFDIMLNRLAIITIGMLKDIYEAFETGKLELLTGLHVSESSADKIDLFCRRMLNIIGHKDKPAAHIYATTKYLEEITDECDDLAEYAIANKIKVDKKILIYIAEIIKQIELWYKLFKEYKLEYVLELKKLETTLKKEWLQLFENAPPKTAVIIHYLAEIQENIAHMGFDQFN